MRETWVRSLGWKDPLEKGKATHSSILAWRIPRTAIVHGFAKSRTRLSDFHLKKKSSFNPYWSCWECAKERTWSIFSSKVLFYYHEHLTLSEFRVSIVEPRKLGYSPGLCVCVGWPVWSLGRTKRNFGASPVLSFGRELGRRLCKPLQKVFVQDAHATLGGRKKVKVSVAQ